MASFDRSRTSSYSSSIAVSCTVFEIKPECEILVENADFSYLLVFDLHDTLEPL